MTSVLRSVANNTSLPNPMNIITPLYDVDGLELPIPFTYNKETRVLDMSFTNGFTSSTPVETNSTIYARGMNFSAPRLVSNIGPNIATWFENTTTTEFIDGEPVSLNVDAGTVKMYEAPIVVKANVLMPVSGSVTRPTFTPNSVNSFVGAMNVPISFNTSAGSTDTNYLSFFAFRSPLVVTYKSEGATKYAMFNTQFEGNT